MKRKDILTPIGIFLGLTMVLFGIYTNGGFGGVSSFVQASSILVVLGGLLGAILINFSLKDLKLTLRVFKEAFNTESYDLKELIRLFVGLSEKARREGLLALENEVDEVEDPYIRKGVLLAIDGIEPEVINDIMNAEIVAMEERHQRGRAIFQKAGEYAPAWGMIGTLIGLVLMLNNLSNPETIGPSMAVALLTTFYGTLLANLVFNPLAGKLENKTDEEIFLKQVVIEGVIGVQSGQNPKILEEKLSAFLSNEERNDLEKDEEEDVEEEQQFAGESVNGL
ncbi:flagellar motor protein MotP [Virgibacillus sp. MSP4-1]|uniref:flagellar motor protein MotP n=1 Tax=Virgibacillus sp. MSP4-1 TaxID=2700081 RepID=UPI0003A9A91F|nr:flagellar motor protein MotP [Virgibacillus sp. MSP4-1]QHS23046.1 flagellar motor protein MotP [Virgibacillus sp. MSP4-1]